MTLLAIETSTAAGSVALWIDGALLWERRFEMGRGAGGALFPALAEARERAPRCDFVAVGLGPGSFSGIRVALAAATGIRHALGAQLIGLPSAAALDAPAYRYLGDARRGALHCTAVEAGTCVDGPRLITPDEALALPDDPPIFAAAPLAAYPGIRVAAVRPPEARLLAAIAARDPRPAAAPLEPLYLRDAHITAAKPVPGLGGA
jgi:tRNA threonylcarbamoyl adenosine modification protein YeaZ